MIIEQLEVLFKPVKKKTKMRHGEVLKQFPQNRGLSEN